MTRGKSRGSYNSKAITSRKVGRKQLRTKTVNPGKAFFNAANKRRGKT